MRLLRRWVCVLSVPLLGCVLLAFLFLLFLFISTVLLLSLAAAVAAAAAVLWGLGSELAAVLRVLLQRVLRVRG